MRNPSPNIALFTLNRSRGKSSSPLDVYKKIIATILARYKKILPNHDLYAVFKEISTPDCLSLLEACNLIFELTRPDIVREDDIFPLFKTISLSQFPHNEHLIYLSLQENLLEVLNSRRAPEILDLVLSGSTISLLYLTALPDRLRPLLNQGQEQNLSPAHLANNIFETYKRKKTLTTAEVIETKAIAYFLVYSSMNNCSLGPYIFSLQHFPTDIQDNPLIQSLVFFSRVPRFLYERKESNSEYVNAVSGLQTLSHLGINLPRECSPRNVTIATAAAYASTCLGYIYFSPIHDNSIVAPSPLSESNFNVASIMRYYTQAYLQGDFFSLTELNMISTETLEYPQKCFLSFCKQQHLDPELFVRPLPNTNDLTNMLLLLHNPDVEEKSSDEEKPPQAGCKCTIL